MASIAWSLASVSTGLALPKGSVLGAEGAGVAVDATGEASSEALVEAAGPDAVCRARITFSGKLSAVDLRAASLASISRSRSAELTG